LFSDGEGLPLAALDADSDGSFTRANLRRNTARLALLSGDCADEIKRAVFRKTQPERPESLIAGRTVYYGSPHLSKSRNRSDPH
jgi:hypothetical protein